MALFQREDKPQRPESGPAPTSGSTSTPVSAPASTPTASAAAAEPRAGEFQTTLGRGSRVEGRLTFEGNVRVEGQVEGEISAQGTVHVGENAAVSAQIQAQTIVIMGTIKGDVTARKRIELRAPARLEGNITTPSLVINEGVSFEGHCSMGSTPERGATDKGERAKVAFLAKDERKEERKEDRKEEKSPGTSASGS